MTDNEITEHNLTELLKPETVKVFGLECRRVTCGSFSLCQKAKLQLIHGANDVDIFEVLAFFYIHTHPLEDCRRLLFEKEKEDGVSIAFKEAVYSWGDNIELQDMQEAVEIAATLLTDAAAGMVETDPTAEESLKKKSKPEPCPIPSSTTATV